MSRMDDGTTKFGCVLLFALVLLGIDGTDANSHPCDVTSMVFKPENEPHHYCYRIVKVRETDFADNTTTGFVKTMQETCSSTPFDVDLKMYPASLLTINSIAEQNFVRGIMIHFERTLEWNDHLVYESSTLVNADRNGYLDGSSNAFLEDLIAFKDMSENDCLYMSRYNWKAAKCNTKGQLAGNQFFMAVCKSKITPAKTTTPKPTSQPLILKDADKFVTCDEKSIFRGEKKHQCYIAKPFSLSDFNQQMVTEVDVAKGLCLSTKLSLKDEILTTKVLSIGDQQEANFVTSFVHEFMKRQGVEEKDQLFGSRLLLGADGGGWYDRGESQEYLRSQIGNTPLGDDICAYFVAKFREPRFTTEKPYAKDELVPPGPWIVTGRCAKLEDFDPNSFYFVICKTHKLASFKDRFVDLDEKKSHVRTPWDFWRGNAFTVRGSVVVTVIAMCAAFVPHLI